MADMAFDPDAYLKQKTVVAQAPSGFDPDAYLKQKAAPDDNAVQSFSKQHQGLIQGGLNALPAAGMMGGGVLGAAAGPVGAVGGAAGGGALGQQLKGLGEMYLLGKDKKEGDLAKDTAQAGVAGASAEAGGMVLGKGAEALADTPFAKSVGGYVGGSLAKAGETISGLPKKVIEAYAKRSDEIERMAKSSDYNVAQAADNVREQFLNQIKTFKDKWNDTIGETLKGNNEKVDGNKILDSINEAKSKINSKLYPGELQNIDKHLADQVKAVQDDNGMISVSDAHDLKRNLQDLASTAYQRPGQIFQTTNEAATVAKSGAAKARELVSAAVPNVAKANSKLAELHDIEDSINKNMLAEGKPEAGLIAAGTGSNERNVLNLEKLGKLTGNNMTAPAENLAAMKYIGDAKWNPLEQTGKAAARMGTGALLGGAESAREGHGFGPGAAIGALLANPATVKAAIKGGLLSKEAIQALVSTPAGQGLLGKMALQAGK